MKCVVCQRREADGPQVCRSCPPWLDGLLVEIVELYALAPAAVIPTRGGGPKVSGSREAPVPARLDVLDLLGQPRVPNPTRYRDKDDPELLLTHQRPEDAVGYLSVATALDQWVRDWRDVLCPDHHLPVPTVSTLVGWLRVRLEEACDRHPAIDEFAVEIRQIKAVLLHTLGSTRHSGEPIGKCPILFDSGERCGATLHAEPYVDHIACPRCGTSWPRAKWLALAAGMQDAQIETEEAA